MPESSLMFIKRASRSQARLWPFGGAPQAHRRLAVNRLCAENQSGRGENIDPPCARLQRAANCDSKAGKNRACAPGWKWKTKDEQHRIAHPARAGRKENPRRRAGGFFVADGGRAVLGRL